MDARAKKAEIIKGARERRQVLFELTWKGQPEAFKQKILTTKQMLPKNFVCLVGFDVPENVRKTRYALRYFLKKVGFKQLHLSVWESRFDVVELMREFVKALDYRKMGKSL